MNSIIGIIFAIQLQSVAKLALFLVMLCKFSTFKDRKNNELLKKRIMVIIQNLQLHD